MKYILIILTAFFLASVPVFSQPESQTIKYNIRVMGINIGELTVKQQKTGNDIVIDVVTDVKVKIIFTYQVKFLQHSLYRDGSLMNSHVQTVKNGNINSDTKLTRDGDAYILVKDGDSTLVHEKITYSGSLLYFNEPKQVSLIYKEISGNKSYIKYIENQTYVVTDEKGRVTNRYVYEKGILDRAEIKHTLATIYMERSESQMLLKDQKSNHVLNNLLTFLFAFDHS